MGLTFQTLKRSLRFGPRRRHSIGRLWAAIAVNILMDLAPVRSLTLSFPKGRREVSSFLSIVAIGQPSESPTGRILQKARARGWAEALPQYTLAPDAALSDMVIGVAAAIELAAVQVDGPIRRADHSAGGHLVTRMIGEDSPLSVLNRVDHVVSIIGVYELRPLLHTSMNDTLKLTEMSHATP